MKTLASMVVAALGVFGLGWQVAHWELQSVQPNCPSEDSCAAQYDGATHAWTIIHLTP
jgi:hypothetical protein